MDRISIIKFGQIALVNQEKNMNCIKCWGMGVEMTFEF